VSYDSEVRFGRAASLGELRNRDTSERNRIGGENTRADNAFGAGVGVIMVSQRRGKVAPMARPVRRCGYRVLRHPLRVVASLDLQLRGRLA
jgi:hypothetical protein